MSGSSGSGAAGAAGAAGAGAGAGALTWTGAAATGTAPPVETGWAAAGGAGAGLLGGGGRSGGGLAGVALVDPRRAAGGAARAGGGQEAPMPAPEPPPPSAWRSETGAGWSAGAGAPLSPVKDRGASGVWSSAPAWAAAVMPKTPAASEMPTGAGAIRGRLGRRSARVRRAGAGCGSTGAGPLLLGVDVGLEGGQRDGVLGHLVDGQAATADPVAARHHVQRALEALQGAAVTDVAGGPLPRRVAQLQQQLAADPGVGLPGTREGQCAVQFGVAKRVERGVHPWRAPGSFDGARRASPPAGVPQTSLSRRFSGDSAGS